MITVSRRTAACIKLEFAIPEYRGAGTVSGQCGQRFLEKIRREAPKNFLKFAHPGFQFAHSGFNSMGGQRPSSDYLNYLNKS